MPARGPALSYLPDDIEDLLRAISEHPEKVLARLSAPAGNNLVVSLGALLGVQQSSAEQSSLDRFVYERFEPCMLLSASGKIILANAHAKALLEAGPHLHIDDLDIWPVSGGPIGQQIEELLAENADGPRVRSSRAKIGQFSPALAFVMVAVPQSGSRAREDILFMLGPTAEAEGQHGLTFRRHYLSPSEIEIVEAFLKGRTLNEIAEARGRSLATVRKQFYTICDKFGVTSQADLLRAIYQDSKVIENAGQVIAKSQHPDRIEASVLRPGGCVVEVVVAGDPKGYPIILLPSPSLRTWPAKTEGLFKQAGVQCITIVGPGFGKTSQPEAGASRIDCATGDVLAVMDQLGLTRATMLTSNFGLRAARTYLGASPDRFDQIIVQSPNLPRVDLASSKSKIKILTVLQKDLNESLHLSDVAVLAAGRSFQAMSADAAIRLIHRGSPQAIKSFLDPANFPEVEGAVQSIFAQGTWAATNGFKASQEDWSAQIAASKVPIRLIAGAASDVHQLSYLKAFADRFSEQITYLDVSEHEFASPYDMADYFLSFVRPHTTI